MGLAENDPVGGDAGFVGSWYALHTRHQHEKAVAQILSNKGFEMFLPLYTVAHRWQDRTKQLLLPLFPCYVFIQVGLDRRLQILTTPGVYTIVGWAGRPAVIPQAEIDAVRRVIESFLRVEPHPFLKCGDWVRVKSGPLQGLEGILIRKKNLFRLVLSIELLGRSAAVEVDVWMVERVAAPTAGVMSQWLPAHVPARV
jgi:transcription antitermination factor NusG